MACLSLFRAVIRRHIVLFISLSFLASDYFKKRLNFVHNLGFLRDRRVKYFMKFKLPSQPENLHSWAWWGTEDISI